MATLKFTIDQVGARRFHEGALREGRMLGEFVRRCAERGLSENTTVTMPDAEVVREERNMNGKTTVACYLSGSLASAIKQIAAETDRSQSYVMRSLIREALRARGVLRDDRKAVVSGVAQ
jgi:hypothetical protein